MAKLTKKQKAFEGKVDPNSHYGVDAALGLVKSLATGKFDETVEIAINLGVDPRHADQMVRGVVNLPRAPAKTSAARGSPRAPHPNIGTVTMELTKAVTDAKSGQVEFRVEKAGIIHAGIGKASFPEADLKANFTAFVDAIIKAKPSGAKGKFVKKLSISSTMGPGVKVDLEEVAGA